MTPTETHSARAASDARPTRRTIIVVAAAVAMAVALYLPALTHPFIYDDHRLIVENPALAGPLDLAQIVLRDVNRPVVALSYALDRAVWGAGPSGFRLTNVALHAINVALAACLAWLAAGDWRRRRPAGQAAIDPGVVAAVVAVLFASHPMMTGAVGYISARSELLSGALVMAALLLLRAWMTGGRVVALGAGVIAWALAIGTRETAVLLPVLLLLWDRWLQPGSGRSRDRRRWRLHLPLLVAVVLLVALRVGVFTLVEHGGDVTAEWRFLLVEFDVARRYLMLLLLPAGQSIFHAVDPIERLADARAIGGLAFVGAMVAAAWMARHRAPVVALGISWFLLLLAPSAALVVMDRGEPMVEHRVYLASVGLWLLAGTAAGALATRVRAQSRALRFAVIALAAAVVLGLAGRTIVRNALWASPVLVWLEAGERAPDHWLPPLLLGEELHRIGAHDQAAAAFRRVIERRPAEIVAYGKLGVCLTETGDLAGAREVFTRLRGLHARSAEASNGLATVALLEGDFATARRGFLETLELDAGNIAARRGLAVIAERPDGDPAEALRWCEDVRRLAPASAGIDECISRNQARLAGRGGR